MPRFGHRSAAFFLGLALLVLVADARSAEPPVITQQPRSWAAVEGSSCAFSVTATGDAPLSYQWRWKGADLAGQTSSTLSLVNVRTNHAGGYQVVVSNSVGTVTSLVATLTVRRTNDPGFAPPQGGWTYLYTGDGVDTDQDAALDGTWSHGNSSDQWDELGRGPGAGAAGGLSSSNGILTIEDDLSSSVPNGKFYFTHNLLQDGLTNATTILNDGMTVSFRARLSPPSDPLLELGSAPNGWMNWFDGMGIFGIRQASTNSTLSGGIISFSLNRAVEDFNTTSNFTFAAAGLHMNNLNGNTRSSLVDPGESGTINLLPLDPGVFHEFWINIQDNYSTSGTHRVTIYLDGNKTPTQFDVTAGSRYDVPVNDPTSTNYLALGLPVFAQVGAVEVDFIAYRPGVILPAGLNDPVGFSVLPASQANLLEGQIATFSCSVTGTPPYSLQWYKNGAAIAGATNLTYATPPVSPPDNGAQFVVVVTNLFSVATSSPPAFLNLMIPPTITAQPQSLLVTNGDPASFSVTTSGGAAFYQWRFNGNPIAGATTSTYLIISAGPAHAGDYTVVVTNSVGSVTSDVATLTVHTFDYGDAPAPYPVLRTSNGARHLFTPGVRLGGSVDDDLDGQPGSAALGDDLGGIDDEDGVRFLTPLQVGQLATVEVVASVNGFLAAWIDFARDGSWAQPGDQILTNQFVGAGTNTLIFRVPASAASAGTFARFRFGTAGGLAIDGPAADGEVEDYAVDIQPVAALVLLATDFPDPVAVGSNLTYTVIVSNVGPSSANGVTLTNVLPAGVSFVSAAPSQGSCSQAGGIVTCSLGGLGVGASATVAVVGVPLTAGPVTGGATVRANEADPNLADNSAAVTTAVLDPPVITTPPHSLTVTNGNAAIFTVIATGAAPLRYQWRLGSSDLIGETNSSLAINPALPANAGTYAVRITNQVGAALSAPVTLTVLVPPAITAQPQGGTNAAGSAVSFSVGATGTAPLAYQWYRDAATLLPGATSSTLALTNAKPADSGLYYVVVSNAAGVASSDAARLAVYEYDFGDAPDPGYPTLLAQNGARHRIVAGVQLGARIDWEPDGLPGPSAQGDNVDQTDDEDGVSFGSALLLGQVITVRVVASTNGTLNAWIDYNRNGSWSDPGERIFTNVSLVTGTNTLSAAVPANATVGSSFARFRFNTAGLLSFSGEALDGEVEDYAVAIGASVDLTLSQTVAPAAVATGSNFTYTVSVTNRGPSAASSVTVTDVLPAGVSFVSATASQGSCGPSAGTVVCGLGTLGVGSSATVSLTVQPAAAGSITNSVAVSAAEPEASPGNNNSLLAVVVQDFPVILVQPQSQTVTNEDTIALSVQAAGTDLSFQWRLNGLDVPGATNTTLSISNVQPVHAGDYTIRARNLVGAVLSAPATLQVLVRVAITAQPQSLTITQGQAASFHVAAAGTEPLNYEWYFEGTYLPGVSSATLSLTNVQAVQAGRYLVRVMNGYSAKTSEVAVLTVLVPPQILTHPRSQTNFAGADAVLSVSALGTDLRYQWFLNGTTLLTNATNAALVLTNAQKVQSGDYSVRLSNVVGVVTSATATLTIVEADFGDAPAPYATSVLLNGAYHLVNPGIRLGARIDFEADGHPSPGAAGDDLDGADDEDGVSFLSPLFAGQLATVQVIASVDGFLDAWIDFDRNGYWYDSGEQIFASRRLTAGTNVLSFLVSSNAQAADTFARFRFSTAGGLSYEGPAADGEVEDYWVSSLPSADVAIGRVEVPGSVVLGSTLACTISVTNAGPASATGIVLTNELPSTASFVSVSSSQGACSVASGRVSCALGSLAAGGFATVTITLAADQTGLLTNKVNVASLEMDPDAANNFATRTVAVFAPAPTFTNAARIDLPEQGPGALYPSTISVSGITAAVYKVTVTLQGLTHSYPADLDLLLVGPRGQTALFMSDAGGGGDVAAVTITFDDDGPNRLLESGRITSQSYFPTNYNGLDPDAFNPPAPPVTNGPALSVFRDTDPNGTWSLYLMDDTPGDAGFLDGGWSLTFGTIKPLADLAVASLAEPDPVTPGTDLVYTVTVTNRGPSPATEAALTNALPANVSFVSATASQGVCTNDQGAVRCQFGTLGVGAVATASLVVRPQMIGYLTNGFSVGGHDIDSAPANNSTVTVTTVAYPVNMAVRQSATPSPALVGSPLTYTIVVTNHEPQVASRIFFSDELPAGVSVVSVTPSQGSCSTDQGFVSCQLGDLAAGGSAAVTFVVTPQRPQYITNSASVVALGREVNGTDNSGTLIVPAVNVAGPIGNSAPVTIGGSGAAAPYPSTLLVSGLTAAVYRVTATLSNLSHTSPPDLDILLVGPGGQAVLLMSDAAAGAAANGVTLTFADEAGASLPLSGALTSGTFKPTDFDPATDGLTPPAPAGPYATNLSVFRGADPNGVWSLFVFDDTVTSGGSLAGWSLSLEALEPIADVAVALSGSPALLPTGSNFTCTITVTNRGPAGATGVHLTDLLPAGLGFVSAVASQGTCNNVASLVDCSLGTMLSHGQATITLVVASVVPGFFTNTVSVAAGERDIHPEDNFAAATTVVEDPPVITGQPQDQAGTNGYSAAFVVTAIGTPPLDYQWQHEGADISGATNAALVFSSLTPAARGTYTVRVTNRVGFVLSRSATLRVLTPPSVVGLADQVIAEDTATGVIPFTVSDDETPPDQLGITVRSTRESLLPTANITLGGSGGSRTVQVSPAPNEAGVGFIVLTVTDSDGMSASEAFEVVVTQVNDPPTIGAMPGQVIDEDVVLTLPLVVSDVETPVGSLVIAATSTNQALVPDAYLLISSGGTNRTVTILPATGQSGTTLITLTVTDEAGASASTSFLLAVNPDNDPPTISALPDQTLDEDTATGGIPFIVSDVETPVGSLTVSGASSNPSLVPDANIVFGGSGSNRTVRVIPATNQFGTTTITVTVNDGSTSNNLASRTFALEVNPVNDLPALFGLADQTIDEDTSLSLPFAVDDADSPVDGLVLFATATSPSLLPTNRIVFGGSGTNRTLSLTPATNESGATWVTVSVRDSSGATASESFLLTVNPINDVPVLSQIPDQATDEDIPRVVSFGVTDPDTPAASLRVTATSSDPTLVPDANLTVSGSGTNLALTVSPLAERSGTATITLTANDGDTNGPSRTFTLTVRPVNDPPIIAAVPEQSTLEDVARVVPLTVGDVDNPAASLTLTGTSDNLTLLPNGNIVFGGSGSNRTVTLQPAPNQSGAATITLTVTDPGGSTAQASFRLTVTPVNDPPVLLGITNQVTEKDTVLTVGFRVTDIDTAAGNVAVTATSSDPSRVPDANLLVTGAGTNRTLTITPATNALGTVTITLTANDGAAANNLSTASFQLTINSAVRPPAMSAIQDQSTPEDTARVIAFTVGDLDDPLASLSLSGSSSNLTLVPNANLAFGGSGSNRTVTILPATNQFGTATITITATDPGGASTSTRFVLTVDPVNDLPTISHVTNPTVDEDTATAALPFTVGDLETPANKLVVNATSSNPALIPDGNLVLSGTGSNLTVSITPVPNQSGTATITLRVRDAGGLAVTDTFQLTVNPVNDPPTISDLPNVAMLENGALSLPIAISDLETAPASLALSASSSNPALIPAPSIVFGGSGADRSVTLTPLTGQTGTVTVTITVSDGSGGSAADSFVLTVSVAHNPPAIISQPQSQSVASGQTATFNLVATGSSPLSYQWRFNGEAIPGATNPVFTLSNVQATDVGAYSALVTNLYGVTLSASAALTVSSAAQPPAIVAVPNQATDEDRRVTVPFTIHDSDTPAFRLTVTAASTNTALLPVTNILFDGSGTNRTMTLVPTTNQSGRTLITLTVSDGTASNSVSYLLTVNPVNDPPTLSPLPDLVYGSRPPPQTISLTGIGSGATDESQALTVTVSSSDTGLIPTPTVSYTSPSATGTISFRPSNKTTGSSVINVTVRDAGTSNNVVSRSFTVYVWDSGNAPPTITSIANQVINEDTAAGPLAFTVGDAATPAGSLIVTASASNTNLVPAAALVLGGSGASRTLTVTPAPNQTGTATIVVGVEDSAFGFTSTSFVLTVNSVNDLPTISTLSDQTVNQDGLLGPLAFTVGDVETLAGLLVVTASSSDQTLVPNSGILLGGSGTGRALSLRPATGRSGSATITLRVSDGQSTNTSAFAVTVLPLNQPPVISDIPDQTTPSATPTAPIPFTIGDAETPAGSLTLSASSSNTNLVPSGNVEFGGTDSNRTVRITPAAGQSGTAIISVTVADAASATVSDLFVLTVPAPNAPPTLATLADLLLAEDAGVQTINLAGISAGTNGESQVLAVAATSSNPGLIAHPTVTYASPSSTGTLRFAPTLSSNGTAVITVTVNDGQAQSGLFSRSFAVTVNGKPRISPVADQLIMEDTQAEVVFTVLDAETPAGQLTLQGSSSNAGLVPDTGIVFGGSGSDRSATITPRPSEFGFTIITLTATDTNGLTRSNSFLVVVNPVNDPPTIQPVSDRVVSEDSGLQTVALTGLSAGAANEIQTVTISARSSNPDLIPNPVVTYVSPASTGSLRFTPAPESSGTATVTVTVYDGQSDYGSTAMSFLVTVNAVDDPPMIGGPTDVTIAEDTSAGPMEFTVGDIESPTDSLVVTAHSGNTNLVPDANILLTGSGSNRTISLFPATNGAGSGVITVTVTDPASNSVSATFTLTVTPVNDPPVLSIPPDQVTDVNVPIYDLMITVEDVETLPSGLILTAHSTNQTLVPDSNVVIFGTGAHRVMSVEPAADQTGTTRISLTLTDGGGASVSQSFVVTVGPTADAPTISPIPDQVTDEDTPLGPLPFSVGDAATPADLLIVTAESSNPDLVPSSAIVLGGTGSDRTVTIYPATNRWAFAPLTITLSVTDEQDNMTRTSFNLYVLFVNDPPLMSSLDDQTIPEDGVLEPIRFTAWDQDLHAMVLTTHSSNTSLLPDANIGITSGLGIDQFLSARPESNQSGVATVTVTATDVFGVSTERSFLLTVLPVNDPPTLDPLPNLTLAVNASTQTVALTGLSAGAPDEAQSLTVTAVSSDPALVPHPVVDYASPTSSGTLTLRPTPNAVGIAQITVTVVDDGDTLRGGQNTFTRTFTVSVGQANPSVLSIERLEGQVRLSFETIQGSVYTIQYKDSIRQADWSPLTTRPGTGATLTVDDPAVPGGQRFYRLSVATE